MLGFNYRMTDIQAAIGAAQMNKAQEIIQERQRAAVRYNSLLKGLDELEIPFVPHGHHHAYQSYVCWYKKPTIDSENGNNIDLHEVDRLNRARNRLMMALEESGIAVRLGTHAVHTLGYYKKKYGLDDLDCPVSYLADRLTITLPLFCGITQEMQQEVTGRLKDLIPNKD